MVAQMIHLLSFCFFLIFPFSAKTTYEDGYLELQVNDPASRAVKGVEFTCAQGCATSPSDDAGRVRLKLPPNIKSNDWVYLKLVNQSWALISPWNSQLNVPSFANSRQNITTIIVARKGDKQILSSGESIKALLARAVNKANQFKSLAQEKDRQLAYERKLGLKEIADSIGLTPEELDAAIQVWGKKANDPFDRGIYELYEQNYSKADELLTQSYNLRKEAKLKADNEYADAALNLGQVKYYIGRYQEAIEKFHEALEIRKDDAEILMWLGNGLHEAGKYAEAEPYYRRGLSINEQTLGKKHPAVGISLSNLAMLLRDQGRLPEAALLNKLALDRPLEAILKALVLNNFGALRESQGNYVQAELLYKDALEIFIGTYGRGHIKTVASMDNLGLLYGKQEKYREAVLLHKRAVSICIRSLGKNHPTTAKSMNNLALAYTGLGKYIQAESLYTRAIEITKQTLGEAHPTFAIMLSNLATLYAAQERYEKAELLFKSSLEIENKVLGSNHPNNGETLNSLALTYYLQGKYVEAEPLLKNAIEIFEKALGQNHPSYLTVCENYSELLEKLNRKDEATKLREQIKTILDQGKQR